MRSWRDEGVGIYWLCLGGLGSRRWGSWMMGLLLFVRVGRMVFVVVLRVGRRQLGLRMRVGRMARETWIAVGNVGEALVYVMVVRWIVDVP